MHIVETSFDATGDTRKSPCFLCSWNRRKALFETAKRLGCNKIALGHHQDDVLVTLLMNMTFQGAFSTMPPALKMDKKVENGEEPIYYQNLSFGIGYSSRKSFFADLACRYTFPVNEYIHPYSDYLAEFDGPLPPEIRSTHSNWKLLLTLGWRF